MPYVAQEVVSGCSFPLLESFFLQKKEGTCEDNLFWGSGGRDPGAQDISAEFHKEVFLCLQMFLDFNTGHVAVQL